MARTAVVVAGALAAAVPLLVSSLCLSRLYMRVSSQTTRESGRFTSSSSASSGAPPKSLPSHVASDPDSWIVHYERVVSQACPVSSLRTVVESRPITTTGQQQQQQPSALMLLYSRSIHYAFSRTPQAFMLRLVIRDPESKRSFSPEHIKALDFQLGQRVNGAYTVVYVGDGCTEGSERVEMALDPPEGYRGPAPQGRIISEMRPAGNMGGKRPEESVVFVNETWMWRKQSEPKTLLEGGPGAWIHAVASGWLLLKGLKAVQKNS